MFCTESVINTLVFGNINGCVLLLEVLFFRWLLDGKVSHQWWAGVAIGLSLVVKPVLAPLLLAAAAEPAMAGAGHRIRGAGGVQLRRAWPLVTDPMNFVTAHAALHLLHPRLLQQLDPGQRRLLRPADVADPVAAHRLLRVLAVVQPVAAVQVLPDPRPAVLDGDVLRCAADRVVAGAVAGPGLLLDDVVPVPDDGGAAEFGDPQLAGVAGDLRVHERGPVAARGTGRRRAASWST